MSVNYISAGFRYAFYAQVDENGLLVGADGTVPAAGNQDGVGLVRLEGAKTVDPSVAESEIVTATGDDQALANFEFDPARLPQGVLQLAVRNQEFEANAQGTKLQSIRDLGIGVLQPRDSSRANLCWLFQRRAKSAQNGNRGNQRWEAMYVPVSTCSPLGAAYAERATNPYRYSISISMAGKFAWGATITEADNGTTGTPLVPLDVENPLHMKRFTGDNSETEFNLDYTAISVDKMYVWINGVLQSTSAYTVNTTTNVITITSAPASNATIVVLYEVLEKDLS